MFSVLLTLGLLLLPALGIIEVGPMAGLAFAAVVPLILVYLAYMLDFKRLYGYAVLVGIFMIITEMVSLEAGAWAQALAGAIILIIGLWHLARFVKAYPLPDDGEFNGLSQTAEGDNNGQQ